MAGQPHYAFRRSCETADMLQLSTSWYRSWIVNSTVCSVQACAWVCKGTSLSELVGCLIDDFDVVIHFMSWILLDMLIVNGIRVFLVLFDPVTEHPFRFSAPHSLHLILYTTSDLSSVFLTLSLNGNSSPIVFGALNATLNSTCG